MKLSSENIDCFARMAYASALASHLGPSGVKDHIGSSSFITNAIGYASQHLQYLPFGETFVDQRATTTFNSRYTFSAKEKPACRNASSGRDDETQYSYFGARYYDSDLSVWLSVDPMAGSRSWISPYNYCQWNPVGRVDPTGALDWHPDKNGNLVADQGDNEFTLQNYIWRNTGTTVTVTQAREMLHTMYNGHGISNIAGDRIYLTDIKAIAGDHIATLLNPSTQWVHDGQQAFLESEPVQLMLDILLIAIPVAKGIQILKGLEYATISGGSKAALEFFVKVMVPLMYGIDNMMGGKNMKYSNLPCEILNDIGYPNLAADMNKVLSAKNLAKGVINGSITPVNGYFNTKKMLGGDDNQNQNNSNENAGYKAE